MEGTPSEATPLEETTPEEEAAPSETAPEGETTPEASAETTPAAEPELFELPDGRKVDAATLTTLWKEEFMPEFTQRSQKLAELTRGPQQTPEQTKTDPLKDPDYIPPTYDELAVQIEQRILGGMQERQQQEAQARQALEDNAIAQLTEVKASDPNVNEGLLFQYAMKHGFTDLRGAHGAMKERDEAVKAAMTHKAGAVEARQDPVSTKPGATGTPLNPDSFSSSVDYLRALKSQGKA